MDQGTADHLMADLHDITRKLDRLLAFQQKLEPHLPLLARLAGPGWLKGRDRG